MVYQKFVVDVNAPDLIDPTIPESRIIQTETIRFPTGEVLLRLKAGTEAFNQLHFLRRADDIGIVVVARVHTPEHMMLVTQAMDAVVHASAIGTGLDMLAVIPMMPMLQQDRVATPGDPLSAAITGSWAEQLRDRYRARILSWDAHSPKACEYLPKSVYFKTPKNLIRAVWNKEDVFDYRPCFVFPDKGARARGYATTMLNELNLSAPIIRCEKVRDPVTGNLSGFTVIKETLPKELAGRTCIILDDLCLGGRTFLGVAEALRRIEPSLRVVLAVTHGHFTNGLPILLRHPEVASECGLDKIYTTDSLQMATPEAPPKLDCFEQFLEVRSTIRDIVSDKNNSVFEVMIK
jgi:ribose-phosphate pyrophosphokinase